MNTHERHAQTQTQTHRHTDTQTLRHSDTQEPYTHAHMNTHERHTHTQTQTHRHTDTQTQRHTDTQTHTLRLLPLRLISQPIPIVCVPIDLIHMRTPCVLLAGATPHPPIPPHTPPSSMCPRSNGGNCIIWCQIYQK